MIIGAKRGSNSDAYGTDKIRLGYLDVYHCTRDTLSNCGATISLERPLLGSILSCHAVSFPASVSKSSKAARQIRAFYPKSLVKTAPDGFDIIIDDAFHIDQLTRTAFWHLFDNHLKGGGYAIEDWGIGYLDDFADGRKFDPKAVLPERLRRRIKLPFPCHSCGIIGFVKELVDEQGASSITLGRNEQIRQSKFERLLVTLGVIFVSKLAPTLDPFPNPVPTGEGPGQR